MKKQWFLGLAALVGMGCDGVLGLNAGELLLPAPPAPECTANTDCVVSEPDCATATCVAGKCKYEYKAQGQPLPQSMQTSGDCIQVVCDGNGATAIEQVSEDVPPDDGEICTKSVCVGKMPAHETIDNESVYCYTGPIGTNSIGVCTGGTQWCEDGKAVGDCQWEARPTNEVCDNGLDDDCDGSADENHEGCYCGDGIWTPEIGEQCDTVGPIDGYCSATCELICGGPSLTLAMDRIWLGDKNPNGTPNAIDGWKQYGFNLDGLTSTENSTDVCIIKNGSNPYVHLDGNGGIDNSFGHNVLPILLGLSSSLTHEINDRIASGDYTFLYSTLNAGKTACKTKSAIFLGAPLGHIPSFDGNDVWPIDFASLALPMEAPLPQSAYTLFNDTKISNDVISAGTAERFDLVLKLQGLPMVIPIRDVRIQFKPAANNASATEGQLGGIIHTSELINAIEQMAAMFDASFCDPTSPTLQSILAQISWASDIMDDGGQDSTLECNGISIGLGFTMKAAKLGGVVSLEPPPDPCNPMGP